METISELSINLILPMEEIIPEEIIIQNILPLAPQLGLACKKYYEYLPKKDKNIIFPSINNKNKVYIQKDYLTFEYEYKINFNKLNELIEDTRVCSLNISNTSNIFIEIKSMFISILESDLNVINNWKYKNTFLSVKRDHENNKKSFVNFQWIDSFVTSFLFYLYH
jgi:hypothetical protein